MSTTRTTTTTTPATADPSRPTARYHHQVGGVLLTAFTLSAGYTAAGTIAGLDLGDFNAASPPVWVFYAAMFGLTAAVWRNLRPAWWALVVVLPLLLAVGILVYPHTFTPELQTPIGWLENDVYMGLLMVAAYLTVQRFRGSTIGR